MRWSEERAEACWDALGFALALLATVVNLLVLVILFVAAGLLLLGALGVL